MKTQSFKAQHDRFRLVILAGILMLAGVSVSAVPVETADLFFTSEQERAESLVLSPIPIQMNLPGIEYYPVDPPNGAMSIASILQSGFYGKYLLGYNSANGLYCLCRFDPAKKSLVGYDWIRGEENIQRTLHLLQRNSPGSDTIFILSSSAKPVTTDASFSNIIAHDTSSDGSGSNLQYIDPENVTLSVINEDELSIPNSWASIDPGSHINIKKGIPQSTVTNYLSNFYISMSDKVEILDYNSGSVYSVNLSAPYDNTELGYSWDANDYMGSFTSGAKQYFVFGSFTGSWSSSCSQKKKVMAVLFDYPDLTDVHVFYVNTTDEAISGSSISFSSSVYDDEIVLFKGGLKNGYYCLKLDTIKNAVNGEKFVEVLPQKEYNIQDSSPTDYLPGTGGNVIRKFSDNVYYWHIYHTYSAHQLIFVNPQTGQWEQYNGYWENYDFPLPYEEIQRYQSGNYLHVLSGGENGLQVFRYNISVPDFDSSTYETPVIRNWSYRAGQSNQVFFDSSEKTAYVIGYSYSSADGAYILEKVAKIKVSSDLISPQVLFEDSPNIVMKQSSWFSKVTYPDLQNNAIFFSHFLFDSTTSKMIPIGAKNVTAFLLPTHPELSDYSYYSGEVFEKKPDSYLTNVLYFNWTNHRIKSYIIEVNTTTVIPQSSAAFSASPMSGPAPLRTYFVDETESEGIFWNWSFGDGNTSVERNPTHIYENSGQYTVSLNVTLSNGRFVNKTIPNYIYVTPPEDNTGDYKRTSDAVEWALSNVGTTETYSDRPLLFVKDAYDKGANYPVDFKADTLANLVAECQKHKARNAIPPPGAFLLFSEEPSPAVALSLGYNMTAYVNKSQIEMGYLPDFNGYIGWAYPPISSPIIIYPVAGRETNETFSIIYQSPTLLDENLDHFEVDVTAIDASVLNSATPYEVSAPFILAKNTQGSSGLPKYYFGQGTSITSPFSRVGSTAVNICTIPISKNGAATAPQKDQNQKINFISTVEPKRIYLSDSVVAKGRLLAPGQYKVWFVYQRIGEKQKISTTPRTISVSETSQLPSPYYIFSDEIGNLKKSSDYFIEAYCCDSDYNIPDPLDINDKKINRGGQFKFTTRRDYALSREFLDYLDQTIEAGFITDPATGQTQCIFEDDWNIDKNQFKLVLVSLLFSEGGWYGYTTHSGAPPTNTDTFYHEKEKGKFHFSTGIGPFQIDRGYDNDDHKLPFFDLYNWDEWTTLEKLDYRNATNAVLKRHHDILVNDLKGESTLGVIQTQTQLRKIWFGYNGQFPNKWCDFTDISWEVAKLSDKTARTINPEIKDGQQYWREKWDSLRERLASNAEKQGMPNYKESVEYIGKKDWNVKDKEIRITQWDGTKYFQTKETFNFYGEHDTWLIHAHSLITSSFSYYYANDANYEIWAYVPDTSSVFIRNCKIGTSENSNQFPADAEFANGKFVTNNLGYYEAGTTLDKPAISSQQAVIEHQDTISQGELKTYSLQTNSVNSLSITGIHACIVSLTLINPTGHEILLNTNTTSGTEDPRIFYSEGEDFVTYDIQDPLPGQWTIIAKGVEISGTQPFTLTVTTDSNQTLSTITDKPIYVTNESLQIYSTFSDANSPITNATVIATITENLLGYNQSVLLDEQEPGNYSATITSNLEHGNYTVTVTAQKDLIQRMGTTSFIVTNPAPVVNISAMPTSGRAPLNVTFVDHSTNFPSSWNWSFGDGNFSELQNPVHLYTTGGTYTVSLTASNLAGSNTTTRAGYITVTAHPGSGNYSLALQPGWNFVSTPKTLKSGNNTALIFNDVDTGGHSIWQYNANTKQWVAMTPSTRVQPLEGIWIYSTMATDIPLWFRTDPVSTTPTKPVYTGWNAIGFSDTSMLSANLALNSINWTTTIGYNAGTQFYEDSMIKGCTGGIHDESREMLPGRGYWVYVIEDGELAAIRA